MNHRPTRAQRRKPVPHRFWLAAAFAMVAASASGHDTWFATQPGTASGEVVLALGTGERFPKQETALDIALVQASGCKLPGAGVAPSTADLQWLAYRDNAMLLRSAQPVPSGARLSCWLQAKPLPLALDDAVVNIYLDEIRASPAVRAHWSALRARGVRWQEQYVKHARIELAAVAPAAHQAGPPGQPSEGGPGLDLQADMPAAALRAGDRLTVQLLRDGQPLAGLPLVLRNDLSPLPLWHRSDDQGRVTLTLPLAARWLLSGVDLRPSETRPDAWDSRFVSLAIETLPRR